MEKEFNLSEKGLFVGCNPNGEPYPTHYSGEDIKEFIRLLKKNIHYPYHEIIDKLAGEKLSA